MAHRRKTRPGRLRMLDAMLLDLAPELLRPEAAEGAAVVDLGVGARPWTTEELAEAVAPLEVVGVEIAADVVERAQEHARPGLSFVQGSFDLPVRARVVRVMNVLRDLRAHEVPGAHARIGAQVVEGGLVLEGSCGPEGEAGVVHVLRKREGRLHREGLLFWLDGSRGTAPMVFRDRLPRDLRGDREHVVMELLQRWMGAYVGLGDVEDRLWRSARAVDGSFRRVGPGFGWFPEGGVPAGTRVGHQLQER